MRLSRPPQPAVLAGRYQLFDVIASGGMATVHLARLHGKVGFSRTVAVKRLHPQFAREPDFRAMFVDEARVAARIVHPNVAQTLDVVEDGDELFIVMEYIHGLPLSHLTKLAAEDGGIPVAVAANIMSGVLSGLHAAHEAHDESGAKLHVVHRDVSPQNILVGTDGVARLIDFGVSKAVSQIHTTREGQLRGKLAYMAPEQIRQGKIDRQTDIFAASVVLWQCLANRRLFEASNDGELIYQLLEAPISPPSLHRAEVPTEVDALTLRGLERNREERYGTAKAMQLELEKSAPVITQSAVADWVNRIAEEPLSERASMVREVGRTTSNPAVGTLTEPTETVTVPLAGQAAGEPATAVMPTADQNNQPLTALADEPEAETEVMPTADGDSQPLVALAEEPEAETEVMPTGDRGSLTNSQVAVDAHWTRQKRSLVVPAVVLLGLFLILGATWASVAASDERETPKLAPAAYRSLSLVRQVKRHATPLKPVAPDPKPEEEVLTAAPEPKPKPKKRVVYWRPKAKPKPAPKPKPASLYKRE